MNFNFHKSRLHTLAPQTSLGEVTGGLRLHAVGRYATCFGVLLALLHATLPAGAQTVPGAGLILQEDRPLKPLLPSPSNTGMSFKLEGGAEVPNSPPFQVNTILVTGNTVYDTPTLHALVAEAEGKTLNLPQLATIVAHITEYYRHQGYLLARAVIPAQIIENGVVRVTVIEARYGRIKLDNRSKVSDSLLEDTLSPMQSGEVVTESKLNHALLLASDIPGIAANATLSPGELDGTTDLAVQVAATPAITGSAAVDNDGNRYTGRTRVGANVEFIGPLHHGDVLSIAALSSGRDMNYASLSYDTLLNGMGIRLGGSISGLHYTLGDTLAAVDGHGIALEKSGWLKVPLVRSQEFNLYGQIQYDHKQLNDEIDVTSLHTDRHLENWGATLTGDLHDSLFSGGVSTWSINWTAGRVIFDDAAAKAADLATARTQGRFVKWNWNLARLQTIGASDALYLALGGQSANANLDASEKMLVGGPYSVRAYDIGALSADSGSFESIEYRHSFEQNETGYWTAVLFLDHEHVTIDRNPWVEGINTANLSGAGLGLNWIGPDHWSGKAYFATPIGAVPALLGTGKSAWVWVDIKKGF